MGCEVLLVNYLVILFSLTLFFTPVVKMDNLTAAFLLPQVRVDAGDRDSLGTALGRAVQRTSPQIPILHGKGSREGGA